MAKKKMAKKSTKKDTCKWDKAKCKAKNNGCSGCAYFLGFIGAAVYYISTATGFWNGVWGFIKAMIWPAFLVYEVLKYVMR